MKRHSLKKLLKDSAVGAGFMAVGICSADVLSDEFSYLSKWLQDKNHGTMKWLERNPEARCNPKSILSTAKSVICFALEYGEYGIENTKSKKIKNNVARFARGLEYHEYLTNKLKKFWKDVSEFFVPHNVKFCVDTSPILEKALAVRAGIGWQGKNSIVIHPSKGSFFVIGEIITDLEIEPDTQIPNGCGNCNKCISACPTGAIIPPGYVNARKCLSYLTIEHKGEIPSSLKRHIMPGQYGCDICQMACPYNFDKSLELGLHDPFKSERTTETKSIEPIIRSE